MPGLQYTVHTQTAIALDSPKISVDILAGTLDPVPAAAAGAFTAAPRIPATPRREFDTAEGATNAEARGTETVPAAARRPTAAAAALEATILTYLALPLGGRWVG